MQELRLVAVSEDGSYAVLAAPGSGGRYSLPIDDRMRVVARGQFSRLAQYEIEVESPLRPKEIQDRIRAGETAEEIADAAGVPIERVRRFEGPVLAERAYRAQEAQGATVRQPGDSGPGRRLGDVVAERLRELGTDPEDAEWDSRKRADGDWVVQVTFHTGNRPYLGEWVFDPRRRHVAPADDTAARLCLADAALAAATPLPRPAPSATVTPIGSRLAPPPAPEREQRRPALEREQRRPVPEREQRRAVPEREQHRPEPPAIPAPAAPPQRPLAAEAKTEAEAVPATPEPQPPARERPARKAAGGRSRRSSVPSWDEIMLGNSRQPD